MQNKKNISVLGASGSVGMQALDVARIRGYGVDFVSVNKNIQCAENIVREFSPSHVAVADNARAKDLKVRIADTDTVVLSGKDCIAEGIFASKSETVINAITGAAGLIPSLSVIDAKKRLALANKESLVIAGEIVMQRARENGVEILPVDSEHSAIFQSLKSGKKNEIKKLILTASGGPFYGKRREALKRVTLADTLAHPTWRMGKRITVDSATLMNKGFEIIEAVHMFSVRPEQVEVLIHRQSILHSAVEYIDNTVIGEFSVPDMRACVQYAIDYPDRCEGVTAELDLASLGGLTFASPDYKAFPILALARSAISVGGAMPAILNAADEVAVEAFLTERLSFVGIMDVVEKTYVKMLDGGMRVHSLDEIMEMNAYARKYADEFIKERTN